MNNAIRENRYFRELEPLVEDLGLRIVGLGVHGTDVTLTIKKAEGEVSVDDCADVYNLVFPRLSLMLNTRDLQLEVSTPGIQRVFKDIYEFELFLGFRCRLYDSAKSATFSGTIGPCTENCVVLLSWKNEDSAETGERLEIPFENVYKAKLDYKWEDVG